MSAVAPLPRRSGSVLKWTVLVLFLLLGLWYLSHELFSSLTRDRSEEPALRTVILITHLSFALPLLLLPIIQFSEHIRKKHRQVHRRLGQIYLTGSLFAGVMAIPLAMTQEGEGRGLPSIIFAILWVAFSAAAWYCARRKAFDLHQQFVVRSYCIALAFVVIRLLRDFQDELFPFITNIDVRNVTRDWLCFILPLLVVEAWYAWVPSLRSIGKGRSTPRRAVGP